MAERPSDYTVTPGETALQATRIVVGVAIALVVMLLTVLLTMVVVYSTAGDCGDVCGIGLWVGVIYGVPIAIFTGPGAFALYWKHTGRVPRPTANR